MTSGSELFGFFSPGRRLKVFFDFPDLSVELVWEKGETKSQEGRLVVFPVGYNRVAWEMEVDDKRFANQSTGHIKDIRRLLQDVTDRFPIEQTEWSFFGGVGLEKREPIALPDDPMETIAQSIRAMERKLRAAFQKPGEESFPVEEPLSPESLEKSLSLAETLEEYEMIERASRSLERQRRRQLEEQRKTGERDSRENNCVGKGTEENSENSGQESGKAANAIAIASHLPLARDRNRLGDQPSREGGLPD